ncbi:MAG TPA: hypothetical protein DCS93_16005 [Microscillaceae bacterium]|nr:hypothetical protein [Microscillaceae bacterium]
MRIMLDEDIQMTEDEFFQFCQENQELKFERTKEGNIIVMTPTGLETDGRNTEIIGELVLWNRQSNYGKVFGSSAGFTLPDNSVLSPDAAIIAHHRFNQLSNEDKAKFGHICPEFIIELKSPSDRIATLKTKMQNWLNNGVQLGWLIDPGAEKTYIYRPDKEVEEINGFDQVLLGEEVLKGFELDLKILKS